MEKHHHILNNSVQKIKLLSVVNHTIETHRKKKTLLIFSSNFLATSHSDYSSVWSSLLHSSPFHSQNIIRSFHSCSLADQLTDTIYTSGHTKQRTTRGSLAIPASRFNVSLIRLIHLATVCRHNCDKWTDFNLFSLIRTHHKNEGFTPKTYWYTTVTSSIAHTFTSIIKRKCNKSY